MRPTSGAEGQPLPTDGAARSINGCAERTLHRAFKSEGETQIARCLGRHGIAYLYEHPIAVIDRGKTKVWYPDFQLPGYGILIEYFGRVADPAYASASARKLTIYNANGLAALEVTPEDLRGDWPSRLLDRIERVLDDRLTRYRSVRDDRRHHREDCHL